MAPSIKQVMPNATSATPANRPSWIARPSGVAANSKRHGISGAVEKDKAAYDYFKACCHFYDVSVHHSFCLSSRSHSRSK